MKKLDIIYGTYYLPDYDMEIIGPTDSEAKVIKREKQWETFKEYCIGAFINMVFTALMTGTMILTIFTLWH